MLSVNTFTRYTWLLIVGLVSACGSGGDNTAPNNTQDNIVANDGAVNSSTQENVEESATSEVDSVESGNIETGISVTAVATQNTADDSPDDAEQANPEADDSDSEQLIAGNQGTAGNQGGIFGTAKLLVDLVPDGGSYPANFHRIDDKLYFWTVDTDPRFARCSSHWGRLSEADKNISLSLVATHPETGVVAMNKQIMTVGDFAEQVNDACAGYNGTIMQVFKQTWLTPGTAVGEQKFSLQFDDIFLGPDRVGSTDGSAANTSLLESGKVGEQTFFEGDKVFFLSADGLWVSNTLSGDKRKLFEPNSEWFIGHVKHIARSPAQQATFEIRVGDNRYQIWTYDLDTDVWEKKFSIKPDSDVYEHFETLLVDGPTMLSFGQNVIDNNGVLGLSSAFGDVTSFEILSEPVPTYDGAYSSDGHSYNQFFFRTIDFSTEPKVTSIWSYSEGRVENVFSISDSDLNGASVIAGRDGRIYVTGTSEQQRSDTLELWSYDPQTEQLVELSDDDWYAILFDHPVSDEGFVFRYLNTPDGLVFVNLLEDTGRELWFTDGTREGTRLLADINPGNGNSDPEDMYFGGDAIYFSAKDGTHGREPWMIPISR